MNDKNELYFIFLYINLIALIIGVIIYAILTNNKLLRINERLKSLEAEAAALKAQQIATVTDATTEEVTEEVTEATPTEPSDEEITISIREESTEQATETQEASESEFKDETEEMVTEEPEASESSESGTYLGWYKLTAYPWTNNPCADGAFPQLNYTAACNDPALWHKWVYIEGYGNYYIHDTGNKKIMGYDTIDIYMGDYDTCIQFGRQGANVYLIE